MSRTEYSSAIGKFAYLESWIAHGDKSPGRQVVGKWYNSLDIRTEEMVWARGTKDIPISACSLPCEPGMIKKQQGDTCCWVCDQCEAYEYVYDENTCMDCGPGLWPHPDKRGCYQLPIKHIRIV
ncbi:metabotropic glutamate receptor [Lasius niger]|uniref:Metabotropic glutamate receptor n=1 Tax=Lasius niger TaxID=67767 RepID=A0A0J7JVP6_LASNI|nr:metabotropic glutamate receptor [Lasius niger]